MNWILSSLGILRQHGDGQCVCHTVKNKCGLQNCVGELKKRSETDEAESRKALPIPSGRGDKKGGCGPFFH